MRTEPELALSVAAAASLMALASIGPSGAGTQTQALPSPPVARLSDAQLAHGRMLFEQWGCGMCHILVDAGAIGDTGPSLDGNPGLSQARIVEFVTKGTDVMPANGGQMTSEEISALAAYVMQVKPG